MEKTYLLRVDEELKKQALIKCTRNGISLTKVLNDYLKKWVKK